MRPEPTSSSRLLGRALRAPLPARAALVARLATTAALLAALSTPAGAADLATINTTEGYVDSAVAEGFVTIPTLCTEPVGSQGTSPEGCAELGEHAVRAIQGNSPYGDVYWEPTGAALTTTNAFVPGNVGSTVGNTGYAPLFSMHDYDLFGRGGDNMGVFTREEILFLGSIPTTGGGITNGQTTPGENTRLAYLAVLLMQPEGATSISIGGHTFDYSDLRFYAQATGFGGGKSDTVEDWCIANIGPFICGVLTSEQLGQVYAAVTFPGAQTQVCGTQQNGLINETNCKNRDQWMDQAVAGFVEAFAPLVSDPRLVQNFRSQVGYDGTATVLDSGTEVWADFRMEQSVALGALPADTTRQVIRMALSTESTADFGFLRDGIGQLVSQDVAGYFSSCLNCDHPLEAISAAFPPPKLELALVPYEEGWSSVPLIASAR